MPVHCRRSCPGAGGAGGNWCGWIRPRNLGGNLAGDLAGESAEGDRVRRKGVPDAVIARACRIFDPRQQQPFFKTAKKLGEAGVNRAVNLLADVDLRSKSGVGEAAGNVLVAVYPVVGDLINGESRNAGTRIHNEIDTNFHEKEFD